MKKIVIFILIAFAFLKAEAQTRTVQGIVYDRDSKQRISRVYLYNLRTHKGFYNNTKGEFTTTAAKGDTLVAAVQGYRVDTITIQDVDVVLFYLKRNSIQLREVTVSDTIKSPQERMRQIQREYSKAYRLGDPQDLLQVGGANQQGGAGLGIDALYSLLSKEGKNARYLQKIIERDYHEMIINYRYTATLVKDVTGLSGENLTDFMQQYRPSYYFVLEATDYALIDFIKSSYRQYQADPSARRLPPLIDRGGK